MAIMKSSWYNEIFPRTIIDPKHDRKNEFMTTSRGTRFATSISDTLTGLGGDFIIIDDPLKASDAGSVSALSKVNNWYKDTLITRLDNKNEGVIIIVMQRLHMNDLTGFLLETDINQQWRHINIPAIATHNEEWVWKNGFYQRKQGEALQPVRESIERLDEAKRSLGSYVFSAQYQQDPIVAGGNIIKSEWIHRYDILPPKPDYILQAWDTASKTGELNDYSACITIFAKDNKFYLAHVHREKLEYPNLRKCVISHYQSYQQQFCDIPIVLVIENKSSGISLIDDLKQQNIKAEGINLRGDKELRLYEQTVKFENGASKLPKQGTFPWLTDYEEELLRFPNAKHDDQVDATTLALFALNEDSIKKITKQVKRITLLSNRNKSYPYHIDQSAVGRKMREGITLPRRPISRKDLMKLKGLL